MPAQRLKQYLDENHVKYVCITHSPAYTAQEIAAAAHIPGRELAKTVMVKVDGKIMMAVVRAQDQVDIDRLRAATGGTMAEAASEVEFASLFKGVELGAMPPFGNLYELEVYCDQALAQDEKIAFNAGSHTELVQMTYADFARLVQPKVGQFAL